MEQIIDTSNFVELIQIREISYSLRDRLIKRFGATIGMVEDEVNEKGETVFSS